MPRIANTSSRAIPAAAMAMDSSLYAYQIHIQFELAYRQALASFDADTTYRTIDAMLNKQLRLIAKSARNISLYGDDMPMSILAINVLSSYAMGGK